MVQSDWFQLSKKVCNFSVAQTVWCQQPLNKSKIWTGDALRSLSSLIIILGSTFIRWIWSIKWIMCELLWIGLIRKIYPIFGCWYISKLSNIGSIVVFVFGICIWPNGCAHWILDDILSGKMVRHFVVWPKLSILGICIWDLYLAKWTCPYDKNRAF